MSQIFEVFGYPVDDHSDEAQECRKAAWCPFSNCECDGGGNRYNKSSSLSAKINAY